MKKFLITTPGFVPHCGGIVVLHKLAQTLAELGEETYLFTTQINFNKAHKFIWIPSQNPVVTNNELILDDEDKENIIVIYPDIINGNPLNAKYVVRWLLSIPNEPIPKVYGNNDIIYLFHKGYSSGTSIKQDNTPIKIEGILTIIYVDYDLFKNRYETRIPNSQCYAKRKEWTTDLCVHQQDALNIDEFEKKGGNQFLADVFNQYETFICYDNNTFLCAQAVLCGCKPIVVPKIGGLTLEEFHSRPYTEGTAFGFDKSEQLWAENTKGLLLNSLQEAEKISLQTVKDFIQNIHNKIG